MFMRCLLINPFYPLSENPSPPLGLAYLAAALEHAGVVVKILDYVVFPYTTEDFQRELDCFQPDIIGATAVTMTFDNAIQLIQEAKRHCPDCLTVMGGPHISFCAEDTLNAFPELDIAVIGEGEETLVEITEELRQGENWDRVAGLVYRKDGTIVSTGKRPHPADINMLQTPARLLLALGRYRALGMPISMTTSRGCPYHCIFCVGRKMVGAKVRYRNPQKVVDEMQILSRYGFCQINIADDLFTANPHHCLAVCDEILNRNLKVQWTSFARVDTVSVEVLKRMKAAGCQAVSFGIESGNADILKTIRKGITLNQVVDAVQMCNEAGLLPHGSFILGLPGETPETLKETLAFGERLRTLGVSYGFHLLAPFPGTRVREESDRLGIAILSNNWADYHANRAIVETPSVSRSILDDIVIRWEEDFNHYLGTIAERMASGEASAEEAWPLVNLERTVMIYDMMMAGALDKLETRPIDMNENMCETDALLDDLATHVTPFLSEKTDPHKLRSTLAYALKHGHLTYQLQDGVVQWRWTERIPENE
jgi:radical SAM superfamily enzyme YgiQ (UPF0313 family)